MSDLYHLYHLYHLYRLFPEWEKGSLQDAGNDKIFTSEVSEMELSPWQDLINPNRCPL
jgi:hypothetical protein